MTVCFDPNHFYSDDGVLRPQPWMQWQLVETAYAHSVTGSYNPVGGGNKNDFLHSVKMYWQNNAPIPVWCYGIVTRGSGWLVLQARSRAGVVTYTALRKGTDPSPLVVASTLGIGADIGRGGVLNSGTQFCLPETRQPTVSFPLAPEQVGWMQVAPGETVVGMVEVRFVSTVWENSSIGGGLSSVSSFASGDSRIDLFTVPVL